MLCRLAAFLSVFSVARALRDGDTDALLRKHTETLLHKETEALHQGQWCKTVGVNIFPQGWNDPKTLSKTGTYDFLPTMPFYIPSQGYHPFPYDDHPFGPNYRASAVFKQREGANWMYLCPKYSPAGRLGAQWIITDQFDVNSMYNARGEFIFDCTSAMASASDMKTHPLETNIMEWYYRHDNQWFRNSDNQLRMWCISY
uniref:Ig-like domain-containing protein n=1 Tax=Chromera velia CCMP2878 TaxID=1169474 RepID=A0A0G4GBT6_9ALVE|eukprot:Cvel_21146.t1-p1 / transcript=Cvel_21146.t1 / gene=Cvel_21146 / organism=Chromera_velia_CCMP2878 / gene_product=hypothetical protein / transcript_product=hypothetical protein / location=Cvel_scaffold1960:27007-27977(-) / protein_length=199 / sequence_SO=supercontig / SO=protein_coding / is_pseudo=false